jgi:hypothetical protein
MTADPYARLDAVYLLGALDANGATYDLGALLLPDCGLLVGPRPVAWPRHRRICVRGGTRRAR